MAMMVTCSAEAGRGLRLRHELDGATAAREGRNRGEETDEDDDGVPAL